MNGRNRGTRAKNGQGTIEKTRNGYRAVIKIQGKKVAGPVTPDPELARSLLLEKLLKQTNQNLPGEPFSTSAKRLLDGRLKNEWSEATLELGESVVKLLDGSLLGGMPASSVSGDGIVEWRMSLKVSASTVHRYQRIVERWLSLLGNPVRATKPKVKEPTVRILTRSEQQRLLEACTTERMRMAVLMMLEWGPRPSELCGLKHEDRFEDGVMIRRAVTKNGKVSDTKTDRSKAWLPILHEELKKFIGSSKGYLLGTISKRPLNPATLRRMLQKVARDAKLGHVTPMDIRHTAAVNMLSAGVDPATAASITRHSVEMLLKVYHRSTDAGKLEALKKTTEYRKQVDTA